MWILRGTAKYIRNHNTHLISRSSARSPILCGNSKYAEASYRRDQCITGGYAFSEIFLYEFTLCCKSLLGHRSLCLQAGEKTDKSEHKGVFSKQEPKRSGKTGIYMDNENEELASDEIFGSNLEDDSIGITDNSLELSDTEMASPGTEGKSSTSPLFRILMKAQRSSVNDVLEKWIEDGNILDRGKVSVTMINLQKRRHYVKALQFVEWLEAKKILNFVEHDYASHLDLVAKVHGLQQAEIYIHKIPESLKGEIIYRTLLASCVSALNVKKAEEVFNTIRDIGLPITTFSCDQLLLLYKRVDRKKVSDVLSMMEKESIKPSIFTYKLLIDLKGRSYDIAGMEQIVEKMKIERMWPDLRIQSMVVWFYIFGGLNEKAEAALKEIEGSDIKENRDACKILLPLYAALDKAADVGRVWKVCETNPCLGESLAAIEAWGKVGHVDKAEEIFENTLKSSKVSSKCYDAMLRVYANRKLLFEGEDLVKRIKESGSRIGPSTCDALVKLYVEAGEVEKADCILLREAGKNNIRPSLRSYITLLKEYSKRGDIHNAEKIFHKLKKAGFRNRMKLYQLLLEAYLNAKSPAYGFRERMGADNIFPNKQLAEQLASVDALWKTQVAELEELDRDVKRCSGILSLNGMHLLKFRCLRNLQKHVWW